MDLKNLKHKTGVNPNDWKRVHKNLLVLLEFVIAFCKIHKLPLTITSIIRPKIKGVSKTDIHSAGRAFDISVRGWTIEQIMFLVDTINEKFTIGAISLTDKKEREAKYEPDEFDPNTKKQTKWAHIHFQVRP